MYMHRYKTHILQALQCGIMCTWLLPIPLQLLIQLYIQWRRRTRNSIPTHTRDQDAHVLSAPSDATVSWRVANDAVAHLSWRHNSLVDQSELVLRHIMLYFMEIIFKNVCIQMLINVYNSAHKGIQRYVHICHHNYAASNHVFWYYTFDNHYIELPIIFCAKCCI